MAKQKQRRTGLREKVTSSYSRIFPDDYGNYPLKLMTTLATFLEDNDENRGNRPLATPGSIPSAYVYFAQFVDHDLSRDKTALSEAGKIPVEFTNNYRTPKLDLEILYGDGPESDPGFYESSQGYLKLGTTAAPTPDSTSDNDLQRNQIGEAQIYDDRNDLSLLTAQLQVLLSKFHNRLMQDIADGKVAGAWDGDLFDTTRQLVTWHYQWIVRNDLLPKLVRSDVLQDILLNWPRLFRPKMNEVSLPVEFTLGAYQYGHSAVQVKYTINHNLPLCPQEDTMYLTGLGHFQPPDMNEPPRNQLPEKFVLDAGRLFGWSPPAKVNRSADTDTLISPGLYRIPGEFSQQLNYQPIEDTGLQLSRTGDGATGWSLPEATLRRGAAVGLPSGQQACGLAGVECLCSDQLAYTAKLESFLDEFGMLERTPLWYYILREAEVAGRINAGGPGGKRLGPLGSRILAEVLLGVLNADPDSYVNVNPNWQPPSIRIDSIVPEMRIDSLSRLAFYAKDCKPLC